MSTYVLSDLHGCMEQYHNMLEKIALGEDDELYIVGDVIDRGPYGAELLCEIMDAPNVHLIMGNHELMMLSGILGNDYSSWDLNHNEPTLAGLHKLSRDKLLDVLRYVVNRPYSVEVSVGGRLFELVHACPPSMCDADKYSMVWKRVDVEDILLEDRTVIFGHTPTFFITGNVMRPAIIEGGHAMNIDCGCVYGGRLACVRLDDMEIFYVKGADVDLTD